MRSGPASAASSRPTGPRNHRTRTSSSSVRCAIIASDELEVRTRDLLPLGGVRRHRGPARTGSKTSRYRSSCIAASSASPAARAKPAASSGRPRASATRASAASAWRPTAGDRAASRRSSDASRGRPLGDVEQLVVAVAAAPSRAASQGQRASASQRAAGWPVPVASSTARSRWRRIPSRVARGRIARARATSRAAARGAGVGLSVAVARRPDRATSLASRRRRGRGTPAPSRRPRGTRARSPISFAYRCASRPRESPGRG